MRNGEGGTPSTQNWYTDELKTGPSSVIGVYEQNQGHKLWEPLVSQVLQTELYAIQTYRSQSLDH